MAAIPAASDQPAETAPQDSPRTGASRRQDARLGPVRTHGRDRRRNAVPVLVHHRQRVPQLLASSTASQRHSLAGWQQLFANLPVGSQLLNSTLVCVGAIAIILVVSTTAGFAFAKLRYRGSGMIFLLVVSALMVPLQSILIPRVRQPGQVHLTNSYTGAVLVYAALGTPFATFLMATYYRGISDELIEAAVMDGLSYERTFAQIALPLSLPAIATVTVLQFIQIWDDLLVGLLFLPHEPAHHHRWAGDAVDRADHQRAGTDGRLADQRGPGDRRLPDLPAAPGQGPDARHGQVREGAWRGSSSTRSPSSSPTGPPRCSRWTWPSATANCSCWSGRQAAARRRRCGWSPGWRT